jgi:hypothetical protein
MHCGGIRHSNFMKGNQKKWLFRWSRKFCHKKFRFKGADAYLTADLKYHQFYEAENQLLLMDIGHLKVNAKKFIEYLRKKILNFCVILSEENSNPVLIEYGEMKELRRQVKSNLRFTAIDSRIDEIRNVRGELPLEVEDLEDEVAGLSTRSEKLKSELEVVEDLIKVKEN